MKRMNSISNILTAPIAPIYTKDMDIAAPDFDIKNVSSIDGFTSQDYISGMEDLQIHDAIRTPAKMVDHESLGKTPTHTRGAPSLDPAAFLDEMQSTIEDCAEEAGFTISPVVSKELAKDAVENIITKTREKAQDLLRRSMRTWK